MKVITVCETPPSAATAEWQPQSLSHDDFYQHADLMDVFLKLYVSFPQCIRGWALCEHARNRKHSKGWKWHTQNKMVTVHEPLIPACIFEKFKFLMFPSLLTLPLFVSSLPRHTVGRLLRSMSQADDVSQSFLSCAWVKKYFFPVLLFHLGSLAFMSRPWCALKSHRECTCECKSQLQQRSMPNTY